MKVRILLFFLLFCSLLLILLSLWEYAEPLHEKRLEAIRISKIQRICMKEFPRRRDIKPQERSLSKVKIAIDKLLSKNFITFKVKSEILENRLSTKMQTNDNKVMLQKIIELLNTIEDDVVLSIAVHTDVNSTSRYNLELSQKRADRLKSYFIKRTNLIFIIALGYGNEIPCIGIEEHCSNERVEMNLKRVER